MKRTCASILLAVLLASMLTAGNPAYAETKSLQDTFCSFVRKE